MPKIYLVNSAQVGAYDPEANTLTIKAGDNMNIALRYGKNYTRERMNKLIEDTLRNLNYQTLPDIISEQLVCPGCHATTPKKTHPWFLDREHFVWHYFCAECNSDWWHNLPFKIQKNAQGI